MNQYRQKLNSFPLFYPDDTNYIRLCFVFKNSGANRTEIKGIFDEFMVLGVDYDEEDEEELIDYLQKKANE